MTKALRDSEECLQRMEALLRRMAEVQTTSNLVMPDQGYLITAPFDHYNEARAIVAELDGGADMALARQLREEYMNDAKAGDVTPYLAKAIAKGRELERNSIVNVQGEHVGNACNSTVDKNIIEELVQKAMRRGLHNEHR